MIEPTASYVSLQRYPTAPAQGRTSPDYTDGIPLIRTHSAPPDVETKHAESRRRSLLKRTRNLLKPDLVLRDFNDLKPETLQKLGNVRGLILDLDDTIKPLRADVLLPEMAVTLKNLQNAGIQLGIVSNNPSETHCQKARQLLAEQGLHIPFIAKARKPTALDFNTMLDHFGLPPESVVMVGDSPICDVIGSKRTGMKSIRAKWFTSTKSSKALAIVGDIVNTVVNCSRTAIRAQKANPILGIPVQGQHLQQQWLA